MYLSIWCTHVYTETYVCMVHESIYMYLRSGVNLCTYTISWTFTVHVYVCDVMCVCMYVCMCACVCVCVHVYVR